MFIIQCCWLFVFQLEFSFRSSISQTLLPTFISVNFQIPGLSTFSYIYLREEFLNASTAAIWPFECIFPVAYDACHDIPVVAPLSIMTHAKSTWKIMTSSQLAC